MSNKIDPAPPITNGRYVDWPEINQFLKGTFDDLNNSESVHYLSKITLVPPVEEVKAELVEAGYEIYEENAELLYIRIKK